MVIQRYLELIRIRKAIAIRDCLDQQSRYFKKEIQLTEYLEGLKEAPVVVQVEHFYRALLQRGDIDQNRFNQLVHERQLKLEQGLTQLLT